MSCFVISNEQMDAILYPLDAHRMESCSLQSFYNTLFIGDFTDEKLSFLGEEFFKLNYKAYNDRYKDNNDIMFYQYSKKKVVLAQSIKSLQSLIYQCYDAEDYSTSATFEKMQKLLDIYINLYLEQDSAYNSAKWFL